MIYDVKSYSNKPVESTSTPTEIKLSENASSMIFQLFSKSIYSNPIGSVVREITSNCFDSHIEAKVDTPVLIRKSVEQDTGAIIVSFIDNGIGMSPERVRDIFSVFFESTKRADSEQIGGFGLGSKSPLAYKRSTGFGDGEYDNSYTIITKYDGIKYIYHICEGANAPLITHLHEEPTEDHNGTEVRIPVLQNDVRRFEEEMVRQLYYFENVIFEDFDKGVLNNEYQIIQGKSFLFRGTDIGSQMHICLGRVAYPINYEVLGLNSSEYNIPIALRLEIGDVNVTVSREQLDYSEATIKMIKAKLIEAKAEITALLVSQYDNIVTLVDYFNYTTKFGQLFFSNGKSVYVGNGIKKKDVVLSNYKYADIKIGASDRLFELFLDFTMYGKKEPKKSWKGDHSGILKRDYEGILNADNLYYVEDEFERKNIKQAYLKLKHKRFNVIRKKDLEPLLKNDYDYDDLFGTKTRTIERETGEIVDLGDLLLEMQDEFFDIVRKNGENYNTLVVPEEFLASRRLKKVTADIKNTEISLRFAESLEYRRKMKLDKLFKFKSTIFYASEANKSELVSSSALFDKLFDQNITNVSRFDENSTNCFRLKRGKSIVNNKATNGDNTGYQGIMFILIAESNVKYMKYCRHAHHISEFKDLMLKRKTSYVRDYFRTFDMVEKYNNLDFLYKREEFKNLSSVWGTKIKALNFHMTDLCKKHSLADLATYKYVLRANFDLDNLQLTPEEELYSKVIDDLKDLETANYSKLKYIRIPGYIEKFDDNLWELLSLVMEL